MTLKQLGYVLLMGTASLSLTLEGMRRTETTPFRVPQPSRPNLADYSSVFAETAELDKLERNSNIDLTDVYDVFKELKTNKLKKPMQAQIQSLRNFVFTIVSDKELTVAFNKSTLSQSFTKELLALVRKIIRSNHGKDLVEGTDSDTDTLIGQAIAFLEEYSQTLVLDVQNTFEEYKTACARRLDPGILKKAETACNGAGVRVEKAEAKFTKAQENFKKLCKIAKQEKLDGTERTLRQANANATAAREKQDAAWKQLDIARSQLREAKGTVTKIAKMALAIQADCEKALGMLKATLGAFEHKTSKLLNIRACTRTTSFGILCPPELLLALFAALEDDHRVITLVEECKKAYHKSENLMKEFLLTLQHYVCYRFSLDSESSKGFCWEMGVGLFLFDNTEKEPLITLGTHLTDNAEDSFREVDATTKNCIIECKNISWNGIDFSKKGQRVKKLKKQFKAHASIAKKLHKQYVVVSRHEVPKEVAKWFASNRIAYVDPIKDGNTMLKNINLLHTDRYCADLAQ